MKIPALSKTTCLLISLLLGSLSATAQGPGRGRGMPAEARESIHGLFEAHNKIQRELKETPEGYVSKTTSKDPAVVKLLQTHVKQMEKRLKSGLMVRRWDPAYEEFVRHYDDIEIKITEIDDGISIAATGSTEIARKVARNHAGIISKFIKNGWAEHDQRHPAVAAKVEGKAKPGCPDCAEKKAEASKPCAKCAASKAGKAGRADGPAGEKSCPCNEKVSKTKPE